MAHGGKCVDYVVGQRVTRSSRSNDAPTAAALTTIASSASATVAAGNRLLHARRSLKVACVLAYATRPPMTADTPRLLPVRPPTMAPINAPAATRATIGARS